MSDSAKLMCLSCPLASAAARLCAGSCEVLVQKADLLILLALLKMSLPLGPKLLSLLCLGQVRATFAAALMEVAW